MLAQTLGISIITRCACRPCGGSGVEVWIVVVQGSRCCNQTPQVSQYGVRTPFECILKPLACFCVLISIKVGSLITWSRGQIVTKPMNTSLSDEMEEENGESGGNVDVGGIGKRCVEGSRDEGESKGHSQRLTRIVSSTMLNKLLLRR